MPIDPDTIKRPWQASRVTSYDAADAILIDREGATVRSILLSSILTPAAAWVPTVVPGSGAFGTLGTVVAVSQKLGPTLAYVHVSIPIVANGSAASAVNVSLPYMASARSSIIAGRETTAAGHMLQGYIAANGQVLQIFDTDNLYPGGTSYTLTLSGIYETV